MKDNSFKYLTERTAKKRYSFLIIFGIILIISALLLTGYNRITEFRANKASEFMLEQLTESKDISGEKTPLYIQNSKIQMPVTAVDGYDCIGILEIPSLKIKLPVISEWDYAGLRVSPCRYSGSVYQNNLIICAHNYRNHFGRIKTLKTGDFVTFTDMYGNVFGYEVNKRETVKPDAEKITETGDWDLTLFTCNDTGTSRVILRCIRSR